MEQELMLPQKCLQWQAADDNESLTQYMNWNNMHITNVVLWLKLFPVRFCIAKLYDLKIV